ncbi:hypothetical protein [Streptomyces sp. NPDC005209]|uniref:hypothetical protein n=1 Tax=Streptomyces sp. NPDC005209 TaxID=3156715 RepID=UPI0033A99FE9
MPSPMGLLEERELSARQRLEKCREEAERAATALAEAERAVIAREEFAAALAEARGADGSPPDSGGRTAAAAPGTVGPDWRPGLQPTVLAPDYQRIIGALEAAVQEGTGPLNCRQIAAHLGWETSAAGVEGVRAKARRVAERGWLVKEPDGRFSAVRPGGGS